MGCGGSKKNQVVVLPAPAKAEEAEWKNTPATVVVASAPVARGRKLNVLCLHGTTMSGKTMKWLLNASSGIEPACQDLANFYYPTGPCVVHKNHKIWKAAPGAGPPGPDKRHWYTMGTGWDLSSKAFEGARKVLREFADKEVGGPIDVVCGYSQGAAAATQLLNDIFEGGEKNKNLKCIKGAIFLGCPSHPEPCHNAGRDVRSLHCNGDNDPLTSLAGARKHAARFKNDTFFEFKGTHDIKTPCADPFRQFLFALRGGEKE